MIASQIVAPITAAAATADTVCMAHDDSTLRCWGGSVRQARVALPSVLASAVSLTSIVAGFSHFCALRADRRVLCWGANDDGQLGDGTRTFRQLPTLVPSLTGVTAISAGFRHSCALLSTGSVRCWGFNGSGQLGDGTRTESLVPKAVTGLAGVTVTRISAGLTANSSFAIGSNGQAYVAGFLLGDGTQNTRTSFGPVSGMTSATELSAGSSRACARLSSGAVRCWGFGPLGDGTSTARWTPTTIVSAGAAGVSIGDETVYVSMNDGTGRSWGNNQTPPAGFGALGDGSSAPAQLSPVPIVGLTGVSRIFGGYNYAYALLADGGVRAWGSNKVCQLTCPSSVVPITPAL